MKTNILLLTITVLLNLTAFASDPKTDKNGQTDTLIIETISKELYICTCKPNTSNPGGEGKVYFQGKYKSGGETTDSNYHNCDERFLIQWDLSELPKGIKIIEAKMRLVCKEFNGDKKGQLVYECISQPWNTDAGYNQQPKTLPKTRITTDWPTEKSYHFIDITTFVESWYNNSLPNYGLMGLSINTETTNSAIFCSSKFPQEEVRPKLIVVFSEE